MKHIRALKYLAISSLIEKKEERMKKEKKVAPRNFVAKHQKTSGAGRHRDNKSDYRRQPKHRHQQFSKQKEEG